ncbi:MAG: PAS domain S-box protein [Firmicutes bacterium]|nr:PAS domain S-box protein [Bacillota bacterium]
MNYTFFIEEWTIIGLLSALLIMLFIIMLHTNITSKKENEIKLNYKKLFDHMNEGFALHKIICNEAGQPIDYMFLEVNNAFEEITGLKAEDILGKCVTEILPETEDSWIQTYGEVAIESIPTHYSNYSKALGKHFHVSVYSPKKYEFATLFTDISNEIRVAEKINLEKNLLITILDGVMSGYWDKNFKENTAYYSASYKNMFGYDDNELENNPDLWKELIHEDDLKKSVVMFENHVESLGEIPFYHEARYKHKNGSIVWVIKSGRIVEWDENNQPVRVVGCNVNITKMKSLESTIRNERNLFQTILQSIIDGVISIDLEGKVQFINNATEIMSGYKTEEVIGKNIIDLINLVDEKSGERIICFLEDFLEPDKLIRDDLSVIIKSGEIVPIEYSIAPILDNNGASEGAVMVFRDIREKKERLERIKYLSYHDQLTGLYNRYFFEEQLVMFNSEEFLPLTLAIIDVNGLKLTNDAFGHVVGDRMLRVVGDAFKKLSRTNDVVFRVGGDEFVILMPYTENQAAEEIIKSIYRYLEKVEFENIIISVSIGWATRRFIIENIDDIYTRAEEHMYRKKITEGQSMRSRTVQVILNTLNEKNKRERIHSQNVSKICKKIAEIMKFEPEVVKEIELAGLLHDIGKIAIDENILNKKGALTAIEFEQIKRHPESGYQIMKSVDAYTKLADYILYHHERWDGKGYPRGLAGDNIPLIARIINVADSYEAMTANRSYRKGMTHEEALAELKKCSGTQFDPYIVATFRNYCLSNEW